MRSVGSCTPMCASGAGGSVDLRHGELAKQLAGRRHPREKEPRYDLCQHRTLRCTDRLFLFKRIRGEAVATDKRLFVLPVVLVVVGWGQVSHDSMNMVAIALTAISAAVAFAMGVLRGVKDKLAVREGVPFMRWGRASMLVFVANILIKLVLGVVLVAAGGTSGAAASSLALVFGLTLLGEAVALWLRLQSHGHFDMARLGQRLRGF